ncbi:uncharacterized protein LACBIDRAFT_317383 [Laccaria bicolor S238N-H82]|uniref:Predicted protein n=1 Tax=Laccaria bicolor (strain S238N-H82 / ATCC MYA-4686) TaxID=486041 RepID=B0D527_LACBS|nr:uncharacterized protein LACBIDRAFT_317383 [Laccaria bicolor S238N-H82]EDR10662.1 predicted protein [Laccaria bicolor S238N-H82]|eukprot:XP_001879112.1 predicted protein [Laccaria bicolor S238N-H82]
MNLSQPIRVPGRSRESRSPHGQPLPTLLPILKCSWIPQPLLKRMNRLFCTKTWLLLCPPLYPLLRPPLCHPYLQPQFQLRHAASVNVIVCSDQLGHIRRSIRWYPGPIPSTPSTSSRPRCPPPSPPWLLNFQLANKQLDINRHKSMLDYLHTAGFTETYDQL